MKEANAEPSIVHATIEDGVRVVRENACEVVNAVTAQKQPIENFVATGRAHSQCMNKNAHDTRNTSIFR